VGGRYGTVSAGGLILRGNRTPHPAYTDLTGYQEVSHTSHVKEDGQLIM